MPSRCGTGGKEQGACVPWVAEAIALGCEQQPHPFTGSGAPPDGQALGSGSVVS